MTAGTMTVWFLKDFSEREPLCLGLEKERKPYK